MTKTECLQFLGKFINLAFTYKIKRAPEPKYINAYGHIIKVEDRNLLFKDNDNFEYIVDLNKIFECTLAGKRRTVKQHQRDVEKRAKEKIKKTGRIE